MEKSIPSLILSFSFSSSRFNYLPLPEPFVQRKKFSRPPTILNKKKKRNHLPGSEESKLAGACALRGPGVPPLPGLRASSLPPAPGYESDEEGGLCNKQKTSTSVFERTFENNNSNNNCTLIPLPGTRGNRNYDYEEEIARHDRSKEEPRLSPLSLFFVGRKGCSARRARARPRWPVHRYTHRWK